jgi:microcystin-dependent protein
VPVPNKSQTQIDFDAAIDATLTWNVTHSAETVILVNWMQTTRDEVAATALLAGTLPALAGSALKVMRVNAAETAVGFAPINPVVLAGFATIPTAGGTTTLTNASASYIRFTGTLAQTVVLPVVSTLDQGWCYEFENTTTALITVNSSGGNLVATIPPGATARIRCVLITGTSAASWSLISLDSLGNSNPGDVKFVAYASAPVGWLKANGAVISRTTYARLFANIGTTFGAGDGSTTFALPDLRGEFIRGWDDGRGIDSGRAIGSAQAEALLNHNHSATTSTDGAHTHTVAVNTTNGGGNINATADSGGAFTKTTSSSGSHNHTLTTGGPSAGGGPETRPRNIALLACIKY